MWYVVDKSVGERRGGRRLLCMFVVDTSPSHYPHIPGTAQQEELTHGLSISSITTNTAKSVTVI